MLSLDVKVLPGKQSKTRYMLLSYGLTYTKLIVLWFCPNERRSFEGKLHKRIKKKQHLKFLWPASCSSSSILKGFGVILLAPCEVFMCQWCNLLMFVAFLYLYNSKEFLFSFGFEYFIKLWIYPLLFVAFFFRRLCIWGGTTDIWHTRTHVGKLFYLHPVSNHFQCDMIIITVVDIMVRSSRVHTSITPRVVFFLHVIFGQDIFGVSALCFRLRNALIKHSFQVFLLYNTCVALLWFIFVCPTY